MVVYIPNALYDECAFNAETMEEFIRTVLREYCLVDGVDKEVVIKALRIISMVDDKFGT